jgi:hypothetical protein
MKTLKLILILAIIPLVMQAQGDSAAKKPDFRNIHPEDIKWTRAEGGSFWFYYKPTQYFFSDREFQTRTLDNADVLVYLFEPGYYLLLPDFSTAKINMEKAVEPITARASVFVRRGTGANFYIIDHGQIVQSLERIGLNSARQYVFRSRLTDKRYWIEESDFLAAPVSRPIGILSE